MDLGSLFKEMNKQEMKKHSVNYLLSLLHQDSEGDKAWFPAVKQTLQLGCQLVSNSDCTA